MSERPFLVWEPFDGPVETWTRARFDAGADALAAGLQRRGLIAGDRVALVLDNSPAFLLAWTAVVRAGAAAVCLNPLSSADELAYYAGHAGISGSVGAELPGLRWLVDDVAAASGDPADFRRPAADPERPASIQYTSGTTARPKAVVWTAANCRFAGATSGSHGARHIKVDELIIATGFRPELGF